jgi:hypothetical protein
MSRQRIEELMTRAQADEDISGESEVGDWRVSTNPLAPSDRPDGSVRAKSVRVTVDLDERIQVIADARGSDWSKVVRGFIEEGLARAEAGEQVDPVVELSRALIAIEHVRKAIVDQREAA